MTAVLSTSISSFGFSDPSNYEILFSTEEREDIEIKYLKVRELPKIGQPGESCKNNLFFGFFLDGTRNNYARSIDKQNHTESNIARLYGAYPGQSVPGVLPDTTDWRHQPASYNNYFRVYTPGVGSKFAQVKDTGEGRDAMMGAAFAALGERRIIWTLAQAVNNLHRYYRKTPLLDDGDIQTLCRHVTLNAQSLADMTGPTVDDIYGDAARTSSARTAFEALLKKLHGALRLYMVDSRLGRPVNVDPGQVKEIFVSVFGFSRGAAAARAFTNWFIALCRLDAQLLGKPGLTLGGFAVTIDFLGLFDTVASVGRANTYGVFHGHDGWADAHASLRIAEEVRSCLHLVSAHEVRRSFPLDSVSHNGALPDNCEEVVYPGVHSDVGGGYLPGEQGKGINVRGSDLLSRLPLAHMYRAARLAGAPLKLELADQSVKDSFRIDVAAIDAFNAYLSQASVTYGSLTAIMREQRKFYILWRLARRRERLDATQSFRRASQADRNDLAGANEEFETEIEAFGRWMQQRDEARSGRHSSPRVPGFGNSRNQEWEEIADFWNGQTLPPAMNALFDDYVHDSRAWFKLSGPEAEEVEAVLIAWVAAMDDYDAAADNGFVYGPRSDPLTPDQRRWAMQYKRTGKVPAMATAGREPLLVSQAGYLRYRKVYAGGDALLISGLRVPVHAAAASPAHQTAAVVPV